MLIGRIGYSTWRLLFWRTARASKPGPALRLLRSASPTSSLGAALAPLTDSHLSAACAPLGSLPTDQTRVGEEAGAVVALLAPAGGGCGGFAVELELSQTGPADRKISPPWFYYAQKLCSVN